MCRVKAYNVDDVHITLLSDGQESIRPTTAQPEFSLAVAEGLRSCSSAQVNESVCENIGVMNVTYARSHSRCPYLYYGGGV